MDHGQNETPDRGEELRRLHGRSRKVFWSALLLVAFVMALSWIWVNPATAAPAVASERQMAEAECRALLYDALAGNLPTNDDCQAMLRLPTSVAFKCQLYRDAGYPSRLMRKACLLYDLGYIERFTKDADRVLN